MKGDQERWLGDEAACESRQLAALAHDLRTPMCCVVGAVRLAMNASNRGQAVDEQLRQILAAVQSMERMLARTCDRADGRQAEPFTAGMLAQELHAMADAPAAEKRQRLTIDVTALEGLTMTADYAALTRVLTNLLSNAVKYTQRGGRVSLAAALCQAEGRAHAIFTVEDNGMGMTPAFMERMYQPFERARESAHLPGSGLGLSIVRRLAAGMGGEIRVQSACGRGTTFTVRVPLDISALQ